MKPKTIPRDLTAKVLKGGSVALFYSPKRIAILTPELFTEGWAKNTAKAAPRLKGYQGMVKLPEGSVGLNTVLKPGWTGLEIHAVLTPFSDVRLIHVRQVVNLPYGDWAGKGFELGNAKGKIPKKSQVSNKIAEAKSKVLRLGPHSDLDGKTLALKAQGFQIVLQDNRQWTPFLHAFVTRGEASEPAWIWKKGRKKEYRMILSLE